MTQRIGPSHAEEAGASPVATSQAATAVTRRLLACGMAATPLFAVLPPRRDLGAAADRGVRGRPARRRGVCCRPDERVPPGTPAGPPAQPTWHSAVHFTVASLAYIALLGACFVVFLAATVAQAIWANQGLVNVIFFVASGVAFGWFSVLAGWLRDRASTPLSSSRLRGAL
jgi:hypothetical protein